MTVTIGPAPSASQRPSSLECSRTCWVQTPTFTFTSDSNSGLDPCSVDANPETEQGPICSAGLGGSSVNASTSVPRGHRLAWTIPSRIVQTPCIPASSQISVSVSTLSFTCFPQSKRSASSLLSSFPSTPSALSGAKSDQPETLSISALSSHFLRAPSCHSFDTTRNWSFSDTGSPNRIRAKSFSATLAPLQAPRRLSALTTTAAFFTSMSRPSWDPSPLLISTSSLSHSHGNTTTAGASVSPSTTTAPKSNISYPNPISIEDARLLDPSYLSSVPIPYHNFTHGLCAGGSSGIGGPLYSHAIPYVDAQGTLHDPDYRPFPLIRQTRRPSPSPFAVRRPYWEMNDDDELDSDHNEGYDTDGSSPSTPTPFICYFVETHPLKRHGTSLSDNNNNHHPTKTKSTNYHTAPRAERVNRGKGSQLKLNTSFMYTTIATGLGVGNPGGYTPTTPTRATTHLNAQYTATLSSSPPAMESMLYQGKEKEKKSWGGLLWKSSGRLKEGVE